MSEFDFELENISASSQLVSFLPVRDCFSYEERIRVQWDLGDDFDPNVFDYIGLYNTEWESVHDHLAYKWAPLMPRHPFSIRRRCLQFTDTDFDHVRIPDVDFQFLYVTNGEHVVGISNPFRFPLSPGYEDDLCLDIMEKTACSKLLLVESRNPFRFPLSAGYANDLCVDVTEQTCSKPVPLESRKRQQTENVINLVRDLPLCSPSKRRTVKEKVLTVFKDHDTLTSNFNCRAPWKETLNIVHPIVNEQNRHLSVVPYMSLNTESPETSQCKSAQVPVTEEEPPKKRLIFDINDHNTNKMTELQKETQIACLEFPTRLPLLPGPKGVLELITVGSGSCTFCSLSRVVITELSRREIQYEATIRELKAKLETPKVIKEVVIQRKQKKRNKSKQFPGSKEELFYKKKIGELLRRNNGLLKQARYWKNECLTVRNELKHLQLTENTTKDKTQHVGSDEDHGNKTTDSLIQQAIAALKQKEDSGCGTSPSDQTTTSEDEKGEWKIQKPKRIVRFQQVISQQSQTIQCVNRTVSTQRETIIKQAKEIAEFRRLLCEQQKDKMNAETKLTEMTDRVKSILQGRYKEKAVEWRQFARQISNESFQDIRPSGAATVENQGFDPSAKQQRPFIGVYSNAKSSFFGGLQRIPGKSERICPTCSMVFSPHVDPHVIEEHIVFHQVYKKKF